MNAKGKRNAYVLGRDGGGCESNEEDICELHFDSGRCDCLVVLVFRWYRDEIMR